jgi:hypothetical protein
VILADEVESDQIRIHPAVQAAGNSNLRDTPAHEGNGDEVFSSPFARCSSETSYYCALIIRMNQSFFVSHESLNRTPNSYAARDEDAIRGFHLSRLGHNSSFPDLSGNPELFEMIPLSWILLQRLSSHPHPASIG